MPEPTAPRALPPDASEPVVKQTERPHPLTPLIRGWVVFVAIALTFGRDLLQQRQNEAAPPLLVLVVGVLGIAVLAGLAGLASWWFTRFVLDDEELRIETGFLNRTSKRIPFNKIQSVDLIQPLAARIFGLAELRIEVGGTADSGVKLRYLGRGKASGMRDYLIHRAHGEQAELGAAESGATGLLTDLGAHDTVLVRIGPLRLVLGFVLSADFYLPVLILTTIAIVGAVNDWGLVVFTGLVPMILGIAGMISRRVIGQFNYSLAETGRGVRITRGLTNLTSQSVPVDRIQGVRITQPLLWRPFGWYRVDIDVLGYHRGSDDEGTSSNASGLLFPVADAAQVATGLAKILPDVDVDAIELHHSPRQARWLHWIGAHTLTWGYDDRVIVSGHGLLTRVRNIVPHAKAQSVRITQGPLERRLRLADVHVDTTAGPVHLMARCLDLAEARDLALTELGRAAHARALGLQTPPGRLVSLPGSIPLPA